MRVSNANLYLLNCSIDGNSLHWSIRAHTSGPLPPMLYKMSDHLSYVTPVPYAGHASPRSTALGVVSDDDGHSRPCIKSILIAPTPPTSSKKKLSRPDTAANDSRNTKPAADRLRSASFMNE